ncbi:MAG: hypothetical protein ACT4OU_03595 [Hyphomicrobium sp.]
MPKDGVRSTYSQCPFQILLYNKDTLITTGTAFFYNFENDIFLITNWHNVSGRHAFDKTYLKSNYVAPTHMKVKLAWWFNQADGKFAVQSLDFSIYKDDGLQPNWYEHPTLGDTCDIVAIPYNRPTQIPGFMHNTVNDIGKTRIPIKPGSIAFIIGFPKSLSVAFGLPIWKSGYIASEPHFDVKIDGKVSLHGGMEGGLEIPAFFLDSLTREGMSGSPVFASFTGTWNMSEPYRPVDPDAPDYWSRNDIAISGSAMEFVGIYSGRVPTAQGEAALGLCWKESAIRQICESKKWGSNPHI